MDTYATYAGNCLRALVLAEKLLQPAEPGGTDHPFLAFVREVRATVILKRKHERELIDDLVRAERRASRVCRGAINFSIGATSTARRAV